MEKKNKEKRVIELQVMDELQDSGVSSIALVDEPAIEKYFVYMRNQKFVKPSAGESQSDFMGRCVPAMLDEGKEQDQAVAMCISMYEEGFESVKLADYPWDECIDDQLARGLDEESANKLCGWIRANMQSMQFESYTDYPESATNAAKRALKWAEENGWGDCGTPVGKARANQLANGEPISEETIARMASFARHLQHKDVPYSEGCGGLMVDAWGGQAGIEWAQNKLESIREEFSIDPSGLPPYVEQDPKKKDKFLEPNPCWEGYEAYGLKDDGTPNCIPIQSKKIRKIENATKLSAIKTDKLAFAVEKDQQILVGPAMIPDMEILRRDEETGEPYYVKFSKETIAKIQEKFMRETRLGSTNLDHNENVDGGSYVFESWIVEGENDKANSVYKLGLPEGSWAVKMRVSDPKVWEMVKQGKYQGFSIEGNFIDREELESIEKQKELVDSIMRILES